MGKRVIEGENVIGAWRSGEKGDGVATAIDKHKQRY